MNTGEYAHPEALVERFFVPGLAHVSYVVASRHEAIVVDPERNIEGYLAYLEQNRLKLRYIFLTHPHADFVAGHAELSARSGAPILISESAAATFAHLDLKDGDRVTVGTAEIEAIATPGHSPDSICLCLFESGVPVALFSGDTLFAGDVGRPDLRDREVGARDLAAMLYDSLFHKLLRLPPEVRVYPAHGSGSLCGRQISSASFTTWCGFFVDPDLPIALVVESETQGQTAQLQLARIGFDQVVGFITADDLDEKQQITQIAARDFLSSLESPQHPVILDVRSAQEWSQDHLEGAIHIPLPQLLRRIGELSRNVPLTMVCATGYRSAIASSLLKSRGFTRLSNVTGGMQAIRHAEGRAGFYGCVNSKPGNVSK